MKLTERLTGLDLSPSDPGSPTRAPRLSERVTGINITSPDVSHETGPSLSERLSNTAIDIFVPPEEKKRSTLAQRMSGLDIAPMPQSSEPDRTNLAARVSGLDISAPAPAAPKSSSISERMGSIANALGQMTSQIMPVLFGPWAPDMPAFANPGLTVALNTIPDAHQYYRPLPSWQAATDALTGTALGAVSATDSSGAYFNYAGDASKLYQVGAAGVTDKSKGGGYTTATDEVWEFAQFKGQLIATNFSDPVQEIDLGAAGLFADLFTSTEKPRFRHIATIREFLVGGNSFDATDGNVPYRVWWSGRNDPTDMDPDASTQSDFEDRPDGGWVQKVVGGVEYGLIFQEKQITRMSYAGSPVIFQFDAVDRRRGTSVPNSVIGHGRMVYFLTEEGFFVNDGTQSYPIGQNQIDRYVTTRFDVADRKGVSAAIDPVNKLVSWKIPSVGLLFYNWEDRNWTLSDEAVDLLVNATSEGVTFDGLDVFALDTGADTTLTANEVTSATVIDVASVSGFAVGNTVRITLDSGSIHQADVDAVGASTITIDVGLPSAASIGNRCVRTALDALTPNPDSSIWRGGGIRFGAFDSNNKLGYFDGANMEATFETGDIELFAGRVAKIVGLRPLADGGTITTQIASRPRLQDAVTYGASESLDDIGEMDHLVEARYHRFRMKIAAGGDWDHVQGLQIRAVPMGER